MTRLLVSLCVILWAWPITVAAMAQESELASARVHLLKGRYEEARETLSAIVPMLQDGNPEALIAHALLTSRLHQTLGEWDNAKAYLASDRLDTLKSPHVLSRRAELAFLTGDYASAEALAKTALDIEDNQPLALLVQGDVFTETGRLKEAEVCYRDLVRYYNDVQPTDAETLLIVARGAAQYARWNRSTQIFDFVVNTLCPDSLADDENFWPALHFSGMMFLEKYNEPDALGELNSALAVNPQSPDVLAAVASSYLIEHEFEAAEESALKVLRVNPHHPPALVILADASLWRGNSVEATDYLSRALAVNPYDQRVLARTAYCEMLVSGWPTVEELESLCSHLERIHDYHGEVKHAYQQRLIELAKRNPRPGYALAELGRLFESQRRYPLAEVCLVWANRLCPKFPEPKAELAELYVRIGRLEDARTLLDAAFKADLYHIRISNLRKVLDRLETYRVITTEHFVIRVDGEQDEIFGEALAEYLEEIYPELTQAFNYEPPERTQIDVFHDGGGESAHAWFSARMTGLPWLHTTGASTGAVISFVSPTAIDRPFNWARVARHEFVHVLTLQQTEYAIPHWFTEALAVKYEAPVVPWEWQALLRKRVAAGEIFELKSLNDGFQRAKSSEDWQMAYCQSRLTLEFIEQNFGATAGLELIAAYRQNLSTDDAVRRVCGIDVVELEVSFREFLKHKLAKWGSGAFAAGSVELWEEHHRSSPDDLDIRINLAHALWKAGNKERSSEIADGVLALNQDHILANVFKADLDIHAQRMDAAKERLSRVWNPQDPSLPVLLRLAVLHIAGDDREKAAEMCAIGWSKWPENVPLMKLSLEATDDVALTKQLLHSLMLYESDDTSYARRLCGIASEEGDHANVIRYGRAVLHIDVLAGDIYPMLGESYRHQQDFARAAKAFATAWQLDREEYALGVKAATCYHEAGDNEQAASTIDAVLDDYPDDADAQSVRRMIKSKR